MDPFHLRETAVTPHPITVRINYIYSSKEDYVSAVMKDEMGTTSEHDRVAIANSDWDKAEELLGLETRAVDPKMQKEIQERIFSMLQAPTTYATTKDWFLLEVLNAGAALRGADAFLWIISKTNLYPDKSLFSNQMQLLKYLAFDVARVAWDTYEETSIRQIVRDVLEDEREDREEAGGRVYQPIFNPNLMKGLRGDLIEMRLMYHYLLSQVQFIGENMMSMRNTVETRVELRLQTHNTERAIHTNIALNDVKARLEKLEKTVTDSTHEQVSSRADADALRSKLAQLSSDVKTMGAAWDDLLVKEASSREDAIHYATEHLHPDSESLVSAEFSNLAIRSQSMTISELRKVIDTRSELYRAQIEEKRSKLELSKLDIEMDACVSEGILQKKRNLEECEALEAKKARRKRDDSSKDDLQELKLMDEISELIARQRQREFEEVERKYKKRQFMDDQIYSVEDEFENESDHVVVRKVKKPESRLSFSAPLNYVMGFIRNT